MKNYIATYTVKGREVSEATFVANNLTEAKAYAQMHKRHTPEIVKHKGVSTEVRLKK